MSPTHPISTTCMHIKHIKHVVHVKKGQTRTISVFRLSRKPVREGGGGEGTWKRQARTQIRQAQGQAPQLQYYRIKREATSCWYIAQTPRKIRTRHLQHDAMVALMVEGHVDTRKRVVRTRTMRLTCMTRVLPTSLPPRQQRWGMLTFPLHCDFKVSLSRYK